MPKSSPIALRRPDALLGIALVVLGALPWLTVGDLRSSPLFDLVAGNPDFPTGPHWVLALPAFAGLVLVACAALGRRCTATGALVGLVTLVTAAGMPVAAPSYVDVQWPVYATIATGVAVLVYSVAGVVGGLRSGAASGGGQAPDAES